MPLKNILVWIKNNTGMGDLKGDYAPKCEFCLFVNLGKDLNNGRDANVFDWRRTQNELHPTQKPVGLMQTFIQKSSKPNDLILDAFGGSGTCAIACIKENRRCIIIEKDPDYFKIMCQRIEDAIIEKRSELL